jgi:type IV pilus assembly protein PilO
MGKESGLDFLKFAPQPEINKGFYAEIPVAITVTGEYLSFVQFADKVSQYPRIINLQNISFATPKVGARGETVRSTVSFTATTFRFIDEPNQAVPADKAKKAAGK